MKKTILITLFFLSALAEPTFAQPDGTLDQAFNPGDVGFGYGGQAGGHALAIQPDGKIIAFGNGSARLNTNGDFDSTFTITNINATCIALQSDGKIVVGGYFTQFQTVSRNYILRLDSVGNLDTTFDPGSGFDGYVQALALQTDGKIIACGWFYTYDGDSTTGIARINSDGTRDTSFHCGFGNYGDVQAVVLQPDGKIIIGGMFNNYGGIAVGNIARLNADGSLDTTFNQGTGIGIGGAQSLSALALQPDGKIIAGGYFSMYNGVSVPNSIIRINSNGTRDTTFGNIGFAGGPVNQTIVTIALQADGKILVGGGFQFCDSVLSNRIARLDTNGVLDATYNSGSGFNRVVNCIVVQPNGQAIATGDFAYYNKFGRIKIIRLNTDASPDTSFFMNTGFNYGAIKVTIQPDAKILTMGASTSYNNKGFFSVARILPQGGPDTSFHQDDIRLSYFQGDIILLPNGKILVSGGVTRLNSDGSIDTTFSLPFIGAMSTNSPIALQPDGKILAGIDNTWLIRLNSNGSMDSAFNNNVGSGFDHWCEHLDMQTDGKIIVTGNFTSFDGHSCNGIARINSDGSYDTTFNTGIGFDLWGTRSSAIQTDGKIIVVGGFNEFKGNYEGHIVRLNIDGSKDTTFMTGFGFTGDPSTVLIQPDGKIIVGGGFSSYKGVSCNGIVRLNSNGSRDITFNMGTGCNAVTGLVLQPDGKLVIVGGLTYYNGIGKSGIARIYASSLAPFASIASSDTVFCVNSCLDFYDLSQNNPTSWQWYFPGATPDTSTLQNPTGICYNTPGYYDVTLIACSSVGCDTLTLTNFIYSKSLPTVNLGNDTLLCEGDTLLLDAGAGANSYLWSNNAISQTLPVLNSGNYSVTVTSNGCTATDSVVVTMQPCPLQFVSFTSSDTISCGYSCLSFFDYSQFNPVSWQWFFPGAQPDTSSLQNPANICYNNYGSFDVTLVVCNNVNCDTLTLPALVHIYPAPQAPVITISNDTLNCITPAGTYQWYFNNAIIAGATDSFYVFTLHGDYYVIITDSNGCNAASNLISAAAINQWPGDNQLSIIPNPAQSVIKVSFTLPGKSNFELKLINTSGKEIYVSGYKNVYGKFEKEISVKNFSNGLYLLQLKTGDNIINKKVMVKH